jgi:colicin import membrane protein
VSVTYDTAPAKPIAKPASDPVDNTIKIFAAGLAFLVLLVIGASISNSSKFYLEGNEGVLEIWQGKFAPLGKQMVIALPGIPLPESIKDVYSKADVYPLAFQFYLDKADALLQAPGIPDFEGIKSELKTALAYGSNKELRALAYDRIDNIDRLILVHKADVFASRGTLEDIESAIDYLKDAEKLTRDDAQAAMIGQKIERLKAGITALEEQAAAEAAAAEAETEAEAEVAESEAESEEAPEPVEAVETESEDGEAPAANEAAAAHDTDHS